MHNIHRKYNVYSPNATSIEQYGNIPVSLYNGTANVEVPLYELSYKNIHVPISISYNTSGNRPDQIPGWIGLGWSLNAGGAIVRVTNGFPDEIDITDCPSAAVSNYYYRKHLLADPNWKTGTLQLLDGPDEFVFNFLGHNGSFYLDHTGHWQIKSKKDSYFKIEDERQINVPILNPDGTYRVYTSMYRKFVLTAPDGTKYHFGGTDNKMEFVRTPSLQTEVSDALNQITPTAWHLSSIETLNGTIAYFDYDREFSMSQTLYSEFYRDAWYNWPYADGIADVNDQNLQRHAINHMAFLRTITVPGFAKINFLKSSSNELQFPAKVPGFRTVYSYDDNGAISTTNYGYDFSANGTLRSTKFFKLNSIDIKNVKGDYIKKIELNFIENSTERLKLERLSLLGSDLNKIADYRFEYNSLKLPSYNKGMEDHWGYYNGRNYWNSASDPYGSFPTISQINDYYQYRQTDPAFLQAEMLTKIIYPTKGYSELYYEPHSYSSVVKQEPLRVETLSNNEIAGGLRVQKIRDIEPTTNTVRTKEYIYKKDYFAGQFLSSGVLSGKPEYYEAGYINPNRADMKFARFSSDPINYLNHTNGNHITYSEVVVKESGNGFTWEKYSNQDNGYLDKAPYNTFPDGAFSEGATIPIVRHRLFGKLDLERGLLLKKKLFNEENTLLQDEEFFYNNDPNRYEEIVRGFQREGTSPGMMPQRATFPIYTFWPYLRKKVVTTYNPSNPTLSLSTIEEFNYNYSYRLLRQKVVSNSKGETFVESTMHPTEFPGISPFKEMVDKNQILPVIVKEIYKNGSPLEAAKTNYGFWNLSNWGTYNSSSLILPKNVVQSHGGQSFEHYSSFERYSSTGDITTVKSVDGISESIIYNLNSLPVARVNNSSINEVYHHNFEEAGGWYPALTSNDNTKSHTGRTSGYMNNPGSVEQVAHSTQRVDISLIAPKKFQYSGWVYSDGPSVDIYLFMLNANDRDQGGYLTIHDHVSTSETGKWIYIQKDFEVPADIVQMYMRIDNNGGGQVWFDDIRLHPSDAQMTTYTYNQLIGMTSQSDVNSKPTYYEYDGFGRLAYVRDQNQNILKKICYNYAGQPEDCFTGTPPPPPPVPTVYVKLSSEGINYTNMVNCYYQHEIFKLSFYQDDACTIPVSVSNLNVTLQVAYHSYDNGYSSNSTYPITIACNGTTSSDQYLIYASCADCPGGDQCLPTANDPYSNYSYQLFPGTGYSIR